LALSSEERLDGVTFIRETWRRSGERTRPPRRCKCADRRRRVQTAERCLRNEGLPLWWDV